MPARDMTCTVERAISTFWMSVLVTGLATAVTTPVTSTMDSAEMPSVNLSIALVTPPPLLSTACTVRPAWRSTKNVHWLWARSLWTRARSLMVLPTSAALSSKSSTSVHTVLDTPDD